MASNFENTETSSVRLVVDQHYLYRDEGPELFDWEQVINPKQTAIALSLVQEIKDRQADWVVSQQKGDDSGGRRVAHCPSHRGPSGGLAGAVSRTDEDQRGRSSGNQKCASSISRTRRRASRSIAAVTPVGRRFDLDEAVYRCRWLVRDGHAIDALAIEGEQIYRAVATARERDSQDRGAGRIGLVERPSLFCLRRF
jgi:hypothetical protein